MSSPSHRRQRSSVSGTPKKPSKRSSKAVPSSPPDPSAAQLLGEAASSQAGSRASGTPRNSRQPPPSSSPLNFRSSSVVGGDNAASPFAQSNDGGMTEGDRTPRAGGNLVGGEYYALDYLVITTYKYRFVSNPLCLYVQSWPWTPITAAVGSNE
jgi:DNA replication licensing factor MCM4